MFELICGDCRDVMAGMADSSIDAIVTDPPAGISFMGKDWDHDRGGRAAWISWMQERASEALRVAKPGAHALVWAIPRTSHWTATAWEDAGWEVRDRISHLFGSGFPKSHNLGEGRGTALKPAMEDWWLLRKPLSEATVAANVLEHGTGALNVDGCRVEGRERTEYGLATAVRSRGATYGAPSESADFDSSKGRWPANIIHDGSDEVEAAFAAFGITRSAVGLRGIQQRHDVASPDTARPKPGTNTLRGHSDVGTASRFFYCAKASKADRDDGLDGMSEIRAADVTGRKERSAGLLMDDGTRPNGHKNPFAGTSGELRRNAHPTVKPTALMRYLCRLVTPPGGLVLDMFAGTGSTGRGAVLEGFRFVGIEQSQEWVDVAQRRIQAVVERKARDDTGQRQARLEGI